MSIARPVSATPWRDWSDEHPPAITRWTPSQQNPRVAFGYTVDGRYVRREEQADGTFRYQWRMLTPRRKR